MNPKTIDTKPPRIFDKNYQIVLNHNKDEQINAMAVGTNPQIIFGRDDQIMLILRKVNL